MIKSLGAFLLLITTLMNPSFAAVAPGEPIKADTINTILERLGVLEDSPIANTITAIQTSINSILTRIGVLENDYDNQYRMASCDVYYQSGDNYVLGSYCSNWIQSMHVIPGENGRIDFIFKPTFVGQGSNCWCNPIGSSSDQGNICGMPRFGESGATGMRMVTRTGASVDGHFVLACRVKK